jgi:methyl-accepting chemotaxis protein
MEENEGTFKIDLSESDGVEEKISNIVPPRKSNGSKTKILETPATKNHTSLYIAIGLVLIGILFVFGYYSLWSAIKTINIAGTEEIANLSREINEKITGVNQLMEDQKKTFKDELSGVNTKIKTIDSSLSTVNKAEKANKSELQAGIADIKKALDPLKNQIDALKQQTDKMSGKTDEVSGSVVKIQSAIQKNQQEIEKISASNIDAVKLESALKKERDAGKQAINSLTSEISTLKKSIKDLEDRVSRLKSTSSVAPAPSTGTSNTTKAPSTGSPAPKPGGIIEEEIY